MSETLVIDTSDGLFREERVDPLPLLSELHPMLKMALEEYKTPLPNTPMDTLIARMKMTMKLYGGIGLSANQVGVMHRMFVMGTDDFFVACINPKVIEQSKETEVSIEGCLSFPGLQLKVERPKWVIAEYTDAEGQVQQTKFEGITARCYLHELDHMNGICYTSHVKPVALQMARQKAEKLVKKTIRNMRKI
jgi:peptide deformylase